MDLGRASGLSRPSGRYFILATRQAGLEESLTSDAPAVTAIPYSGKSDSSCVGAQQSDPSIHRRGGLRSSLAALRGTSPAQTPLCGGRQAEPYPVSPDGSELPLCFFWRSSRRGSFRSPPGRQPPSRSKWDCQDPGPSSAPSRISPGRPALAPGRRSLSPPLPVSGPQRKFKSAPRQPTSRLCSIDESVAHPAVSSGHVPDTPMGF